MKNQADDGAPFLISKYVLSTFILQTPMHAWTASRHLNPEYVDVIRTDFDVGNAAHKMILENEAEKGYRVCAYKTWQSNAAKAEREAAYEAGEIPLLPHQYENCIRIYEAARRQLPDMENSSTVGDGTAGHAEVSRQYQHDLVLCRCRFDWYPHANSKDGRHMHDLKTTKGSAAPDHWSRQNLFWREAIHAAFYRYVNFMATGDYRNPVFVVVETKPPYAMSVVEMPSEVLMQAEDMVMRGLEAYQAACLSGEWPGYGTGKHIAMPTAWQLAEAEGLLA